MNVVAERAVTVLTVASAAIVIVVSTAALIAIVTVSPVAKKWAAAVVTVTSPVVLTEIPVEFAAIGAVRFAQPVPAAAPVSAVVPAPVRSASN